MKTTFIKRSKALLTSFLVLTTLFSGSVSSLEQKENTTNTATNQTSFAILLNGTFAGYITDVSGGNMVAKVARDSASGLATGKRQHSIDNDSTSTDTGTTTDAAQSEVKSPRDSASGLATGKRQHSMVNDSTGTDTGTTTDAAQSEVKSPRDSASGLATGRRQFRIVGDGTGIGFENSATNALRDGASGLATGKRQHKPFRYAQTPIGEAAITEITYEPITFLAGADMSKAFYQWVKDSFDNKASTTTVSIVYLETNRTLELSEATLTGIAFPTLNANDKENASFAFEITPKDVKLKKLDATPRYPISQKQKSWVPANFKLKIDGVEGTDAVTAIDSFVIRREVKTDANAKESFTTFTSDLTIKTSSEGIDGFAAWAQETFTAAKKKNKVENSGDPHERKASLSFFTSEGETLFTLTFDNLGIYGLFGEKGEAPGSRKDSGVIAQLYFEAIHFNK